MKKFLLKLIYLFFICVIVEAIVTILVFNTVVPQYKWNYNASLIDKISRLESIKESKIILVGNSNVAFGFDSEKIQNEIGMPVVNLGLHGGLGNSFHEQAAKKNIQEGDIVVICHSNYSTSYITEPDLVWPMVEERLDLLKLIRPQEYFPVLRALPQYLQWAVFYGIDKSGNRDSNDCYSRKAFNEYGDNTYPRLFLKYEFTKDSIKLPEIDEENVKRINELDQYCENRGAKLVIAGYPIGLGEFTPSMEEYQQFQRELEERMECSVISDFTDYFIEYQYFYDTALHLNDEGVDIRTKQFINDLKEWMGKNDSVDKI